MSRIVDLAGLDFVVEQEFEDALGLGGDERADAVAGEDADLDRLERAVVDPIRHGLDLLHALHLDFKQLSKMVLGRCDRWSIIHTNVHSLSLALFDQK